MSWLRSRPSDGSASFRVAPCRPTDDDILDGCAKRSRPTPSIQSTEEHGFDVVWGASLSDSQAWRVGAPSAPTSRLLKPRSESRRWLAAYHSIPQEVFPREDDTAEVLRSRLAACTFMDDVRVQSRYGDGY